MKSAVVANSALTDIFDANSFYQFSLTNTAPFPVVLHLFANPQSAASGDARGEIKRVPCQSMTDFLMDVDGTCVASSTKGSAWGKSGVGVVAESSLSCLLGSQLPMHCAIFLAFSNWDGIIIPPPRRLDFRPPPPSPSVVPF